MRVSLIILLLLTSCWAQSDEAKVAAVLKQMEHAEQTGDFDEWVRVWSREKSVDAEKMRPCMRPRPDRQYRASKIFVQGDEGALLAEAVPDSFVTMTVRREGGQWKIQDQMWRDSAADDNSVYALVPPGPGAFTRAGSRWDQIEPGMDPGRRLGSDGR